MPSILVATTNPAKVAEYRILLREFGLEVCSLSDLGIDGEADETGASFAENALLKARHYFERARRPTLADDGGLEVDALGGEPGVKSHRWLGRECDAAELADEVIRRMRGIEPARRTARLRAAAALVYETGGRQHEEVAEASLEGLIAERRYHEILAGFPYRAILVIPERGGRYLAELGENEAAALSQRRVALARLKPVLQKLART